ncbi:MAG: hypothetical protein RLZZ618_1850 [Pseudomonadota bacterium]|jgi:PAS domain S-box-containing protein
MNGALPRLPNWLPLVGGTALAYALASMCASWLAIAPGWAAPLYPAAGIALAAVLTFGWRMLIGVFIGSFAANALFSPLFATSLPVALASTSAVAAGACLQAALGTALIRRFVAQPVTLTEPRDIALFCLFGAVVACLVSATVGVAALWLIAGQPLSSLGLTWWVWGTGDTLGVLLGTPAALTIIGRPRSEWRSRRLTVGLTLTIAAVLMALSIKQIDRWEQDRIDATFERDAVHAASTLSSQLDFPLHALEALHGVFIASEEVTRDELRRATAGWLTPGSHLHAMGWGEAVRRINLEGFTAKVRATGQRDFTVYDRPLPAGAPPPEAGPDADPLVVVRYIEPEARNRRALGVNSRSVPAARAAIDAAIRSGIPTATAGFRLSQDPEGHVGIVIYHAVYAGTPQSTSERLGLIEGVAFVTLRVEELVTSMQRNLPPYLHVCVIDRDPGLAEPRLAGPPGCEGPTSEMLHEKVIDFAGRSWALRVSARITDVPDARERNALLFSLFGLLATTLLGSLLLTITGRAQRIETAVNERTVALNREIAERERTEAELRESEQRFRNILNNVPIGVVYTDLSGNVKQVNPRFGELTGYASEELEHMNLQQLRPPDDPVEDLVLTRQLVEGDIPMYRRQGRYLRRDGRQVWVQSVVTLLRDPQGRAHRIVAVVEDITEHLRLADAERARALAEAANLAKSEFLSRMSHELRTPLNAMLGFAQLLELDQNHPLPEVQRPWVAQIQSAGWHLLDMINDVLDLSRIESGTLNLQPHSLDLAVLLASTRSLIERDAEQRGITITQELPPGLTRVMGDPTRVKQILTNLLSNAVKYNIDGGRIHVATSAGDHDSIRITVTDTGIGMDPDQLRQLFQPFNRLGRERTAMEGTGIGLVISQRLAELMGGSLRVHTAEGDGSSFILSLPRADAPLLLPPVTELAEAEMSGYHQRVVHYVEDNEMNVEVMRGVLLRRPQVRLDVSMTGLDGLATIRATIPDLILLDMHLPDISGLELLHALKNDPDTAGIPVVAVSADALASQIEAAMKGGALQYLTKPISVTQMLSAIDAVLEGTDTRFG